MQSFKFVKRTNGISKEKKEPYDLSEVSDGLSSFTVTNGSGVGEQLATLKKGDSFEAVVNIEKSFDGLRATLVKVVLGK